MFKRLSNFLKTLDDTEKKRYLIFTVLILVFVFGSLTYLNYITFVKQEKRYFLKNNEFKQLVQLVSETQARLQNRPKIDHAMIEKLVGDLGLSKQLLSITLFNSYNLTGYELEFEQIPSEIFVNLLKLFNEKGIMLYRFNIQHLPTTGNYNVKIILY
ncbi:MAG: hypothetical protein N3C60_03225 [Calditerrivibrio sp.]|nr:hypothetical protein [Calditerrivibrio sp.]